IRGGQSIVYQHRLVVLKGHLDGPGALDELAEPLRLLGVRTLRERWGNDPKLHATEIDASDDVGAAADGREVVRHLLARQPIAGLGVVIDDRRSSAAVLKI